MYRKKSKALGKTRLSRMMHDIFARLMEARIDIKNKGTDENDLLIDNVSDALCIVSKPGWFGKDGVGYSIKSLAGSIKFTATFKKDGRLNLYLHTEPFFSADGKNRRIPIWLDYTSLIIDDAIIFSEKNQLGMIRRSHWKER